MSTANNGRDDSGTPRKCDKSALRESGERYRALFEQAGDGIFILDTSGRIISVNESFARMHGFTVEEMLRLGLEGLDVEGVAPVPERIRRIMAGEILSFEAWHYHKDGHTFPLTVTTNLVSSDGEQVIVAIHRDITELKKTENALAQRLIGLSSPLGDTSDIKFEDLFNIEEIQRIQDAFARATGVASIITDTKGNPITRPSNFCHLCQNIIRKTEKGLANCHHSDEVLGRMRQDGPIMQPCLSGGLWDGGTSICVGDRQIANWLIGQVLDTNQDDEAMLSYAREIGADEEEFRQALAKVTRMPKEQFAKVCHRSGLAVSAG